MSNQAFQSTGNTVALRCNAAPSSSGLVVIGNGSSSSYLIQNLGGGRAYYLMMQSVYLGNGIFSPATGTITNPNIGGNGFVLPPFSQQVVIGPPNATFFGISQIGLATFYITPGEGVLV